MGILNWNGDAVIEKVTEAAREAIDETTAAAVEDANGTKLDLPPHTASGYRWHGVSPRTVDSVVSEPAEVDGDMVSGRFGDTAGEGNYGAFLDRMKPYLRPAGDREFPQLADRIRDRLD